MYRLSQIIVVFILFTEVVFSQNPHGNDFKIVCAKCHTSDSWTVDFKNIKFDHKETFFNLEGQHELIECSDCHKSLILSDVKTKCSECHEDMHSNTLSMNCENCHNSNDWLVDDIPTIHEETGFVLTGAHISLSCEECHTQSTELVFEPISFDCFSCHEKDFNQTSNPNHIEENFPIDCNECHDLDALNWVISHDFFPLEKGHANLNCLSCHTESNYMNASSECISCHSNSYENATNPDHESNMFSKDCAECHTLDPGWAPAEYKFHDENDFPIYSGKHKGEWSQCTDCHLDPNNYSSFTCIDCHEHEKSKMDDEHDDENGYIYESQACYKCHPDGDE